MKPIRLSIVMPVYNDWHSASLLLEKIGATLSKHGLTAKILLIDDGSSEPVQISVDHLADSIAAVEVLHIRRNLGHQRAICIAIASLAETKESETIVIMDSDGEDHPRYVPELITKFEELRGTRVVFAERTKRSESFIFGICYLVYRLLHRLLVGHRVRVGNFSVLSQRHLESLSLTPELWNHYAAAVFVSKIGHVSIPTARAKRIAGHSKMSFVKLVIHGLCALSVFSERLGVRLLLGILACVGFTLVLGSTVLGIRLFTDLAIPGWATFTLGILLIVLVQLISLALMFTFLILSSRMGGVFLPARDHVHFIDSREVIHG